MKETEDGVCVGGERQGAKERKEAVAFPAATGERHVSFSCSLRGRLRTAGTFQSFPCMRETLHLGSRKVKFCFFSMRYICCSIKESSDIRPTKGPFHWETILQGRPHLQNKPRSRPQSKLGLLQPEISKRTDSAESKSEPGFILYNFDVCLWVLK